MELHQFCFPVRKLSNELVELTPFSAPKHAPVFYNLSREHSGLYAHYPQGPYDNYEDFMTSFVCGLLAQTHECQAFAIIDKTKTEKSLSEVDGEGALAGVIAFMDANPSSRSLTIGTLFTLPSYQRTHVTSNAVGLMLQHALDAPSAGGLGLIRVQWRLDSLHEGSARVAKRMGLRYEGTEMWFRLIKDGVARGKVGNAKPLPPGSEEGDVWQDKTTYAMCWDDWVGGGREKTLAAMLKR
ncbi:hypothetical protein N8I77_005976 [Diaporthe amygdali]|uniref:N-acetyltransferase domain-containing protein n=1 Tax=Phomopsis amygdali TaxID=1214568 RepID=A0AAD9SFR2_PHOAM|nr:hypothetical protein N8I77_005976 [Diaporthe amygdali]